jgi:hypothetical protein
MPEKGWERHEREIAELIGGEVRFASGRSYEKLDAARAPRKSWWRWLASCKWTTAKSVSITRSLCCEAFDAAHRESADTRPMLAIRLMDDTGKRILYDLVAISTDDWAEIQQQLEVAR